MSDCKPQLSTLFFPVSPVITQRGRRIQFDVSQPDIRFATGPMNERVFDYLSSTPDSATAKEIAMAIDSNASRVTQSLKKMVHEKQVIEIVHEGYPTEYCVVAR